ncbi:MAG: ATP-dependent endonuclease [Endomicrobium sp.]|jgi:predicted ATP-dependent endonuclease of OLD family|nr:ATP-dependent endonuclease [Endomicrobium sp.]
MKIFKIQIKNYRLLKDITIDLEDELSLVIGKNNTGKTSILSILDKFLNSPEKNKFSFYDFNIDFKKEIKEIIDNNTCITEKDYKAKGIKLKLFISYEGNDNLANISKVMMDLDPDNNNIVLGFEYVLLYEDFKKLCEDYRIFPSKKVYDFLNENHSNYFKVIRKTIEIEKGAHDVKEEANFIDLDKESISIKDIINFKYISAKREVANKEINKALSSQITRIYEEIQSSGEQNDDIDKFKNSLRKVDKSLSEQYEKLFKPVVDKVKEFGGIKPDESQISVISSLQHQELLKGNTTVFYKIDDANQLPEHYNGLGYMNLIYMIFEIEILIQEFKREPADINLLFIEEPEAHTHPQMQYIFIKNIKELLRKRIIREDGENRIIQCILSTHSSHIVADSDFDDIKYLRKNCTNSVIAKNLKDLKEKYDKETTQYNFLKQYLTISRAEIFFADKAILIEGDTERILIPTIMKKIDIEDVKKDCLPLLSQNISTIEVGAYSQIFDKFIEFLEIKTLIITDFDTVGKNKEKCRVADAVSVSNATISHYFGTPKQELDVLKGYKFENKLFKKVDDKWINDEKNGKLCVVYQTNEDGYNARSFEDAFIHLNRDFIKSKKNDFKGLKNEGHFDDKKYDAYDLAEKCIKKKTHFALDILFHSDDKLSNWKIPSYIKEGLEWLKKD